MHLTCENVAIIQWGAAVVALLAAVFWLSAFFVKIPDLTYDTSKLLTALRTQSKLNAVAALFAAIAALLQGTLIMMPTCINLG